MPASKPAGGSVMPARQPLCPPSPARPTSSTSPHRANSATWACAAARTATCLPSDRTRRLMPPLRRARRTLRSRHLNVPSPSRLCPRATDWCTITSARDVACRQIQTSEPPPNPGRFTATSPPSKPAPSPKPPAASGYGAQHPPRRATQPPPRPHRQPGRPAHPTQHSPARHPPNQDPRRHQHRLPGHRQSATQSFVHEIRVQDRSHHPVLPGARRRRPPFDRGSRTVRIGGR